MLTEKENFLMLLRGERPEWVPSYTILPMPNAEKPIPCHMLTPPFINYHRKNGVGGVDIWGVRYVATAEAAGATLPEPNNFILKDITKWRDVIRAPDMSGYDWEKMAKGHIDDSGIDRSQTALSFDVHFGYFQHLMSFMGFTDGLCALFEEPDEVKELLGYLCDFYCAVTENLIDLYGPDILSLKDDTAAWGSPFMSKDMYDDIFVPLYDRHARFARERGIPVSFHNCGKCETLVDSLVGIGVKLWDPAQTCNDLAAVKAKYGNSLVLAGGWDARGRLLEDDVSDEELIESVRASMDMLAPGGGYAFSGGFLSAVGDAAAMRKNAVIHREAFEYGQSFYKK
ncbi:MAG: veratrol--corrinoid protein metyltransferase [Oscillospiraceae bacterium]|jgi:hypothetical protein|nr:veratrol--corrinoid protein metyltransferase [Oscillospiraceae bacterium]